MLYGLSSIIYLSILYNVFSVLMISSWCQPFSFPSIEESSIDDLNKLVQESSHEGPQDHPETNRESTARRSENLAQGVDESHFDFLENSNGEDAKDFKSISVAIDTRRYEYRKPQATNEISANPFYNYGNIKSNMYKMYDFDTQVLWWKEEVMHNLCRDYLYLARHKVAWALKRRDPIKNHNRYRMGYLFARLRRIHTEMLKIVTYANERGNLIENYPTKIYSSHPQGYQQRFDEDDTVWNPGTRYQFPRYYNITTLMRLYERVSRLDRDSRDTTVLLKEIYAAEVKHQRQKHEDISNMKQISGRPEG